MGVLFDQACILNPDLRPPWNLTVHFDKFPSGELIQFDSRFAGDNDAPFFSEKKKRKKYVCLCDAGRTWRLTSCRA